MTDLKELERLAACDSISWDELVPVWYALPALLELVREQHEALEWYGEQTRLCRLIHSGGDLGREALSADGGAKARAALAKYNMMEKGDD